MDKPNLLDLTKNESGRTVTSLAICFGPLPPDDSDGGINQSPAVSGSER